MILGYPWACSLNKSGNSPHPLGSLQVPSEGKRSVTSHIATDIQGLLAQEPKVMTCLDQRVVDAKHADAEGKELHSAPHDTKGEGKEECSAVINHTNTT